MRNCHRFKVVHFYLSVNSSLAVIYLNMSPIRVSGKGLLSAFSSQRSAISENKDLSNRLDNDWFPGKIKPMSLLQKCLSTEIPPIYPRKSGGTGFPACANKGLNLRISY
jgi:hypothetical protein